MGIPSLLQLLKPIQQDKHISAYADKTIAVDTYCWIHKAIYTCCFELVSGGPIDKLIDYMCKRVEFILQHNVKLIMVFDGGKLPCKDHVEEIREKSRQQSRAKARELLAKGEIESAAKKFGDAIDVAPSMAYKFYKIFKEKYHLECIVAPYEADAQLAYLSKSGYVDYVITEDSDLLAFGAKKVIYKLDNQGMCKEIDCKDFVKLKELGPAWDYEMFLTACILSGCDYLDSIPRVGTRTAFKAVGERKNLHNVLLSFRRDIKYIVPDNYEQRFERAFLTFNYQWVYDPIMRCLTNVNKVDLDDIHERAKRNEELGLAERFLLKQGDISLCEFLGNEMAPTLSYEIAEGLLDPVSHKPYSEYYFRREIKLEELENFQRGFNRNVSQSSLYHRAHVDSNNENDPKNVKPKFNGFKLSNGVEEQGVKKLKTEEVFKTGNAICTKSSSILDFNFEVKALDIGKISVLLNSGIGTKGLEAKVGERCKDLFKDILIKNTIS